MLHQKNAGPKTRQNVVYNEIKRGLSASNITRIFLDLIFLFISFILCRVALSGSNTDSYFWTAA